MAFQNAWEIMNVLSVDFCFIFWFDVLAAETNVCAGRNIVAKEIALMFCI